MCVGGEWGRLNSQTRNSEPEDTDRQKIFTAHAEILQYLLVGYSVLYLFFTLSTSNNNTNCQSSSFHECAYVFS